MARGSEDDNFVAVEFDPESVGQRTGIQQHGPVPVHQIGVARCMVRMIVRAGHIAKGQFHSLKVGDNRRDGSSVDHHGLLFAMNHIAQIVVGVPELVCPQHASSSLAALRGHGKMRDGL